MTEEMKQRLINNYVTDIGYLRIMNLDRHPEYGLGVCCLLSTIRDRETSPRVYRGAVREFYRMHILREFLSTLKKRGRYIEKTGNNSPYKGMTYEDCHILAVDIPRAGTLPTEDFINTIYRFSHLFGDQINISKAVIDVKRIEEGTSLRHDVKRTNLPNLDQRIQVAILDQMIATGGTICTSIPILHSKYNGKIDGIFIGSVIGAPEGIQAVSDTINQHKINCHIVVGAIDEGLDEKGYIVPGLGDAGDRISNS